MAKFLRLKPALYLLLLLAFLFFPLPTEKASSQDECRIIQVGQVPKRLLEIQDELIWLSAYMIDKYSALLNIATEMAYLLSFCDIKECSATGGCKSSDLGLGITCSLPGNDCAGPSEDICPDWVDEELEEKYEKAKELVDKEILNIFGVDLGLGSRLMELQSELLALKGILNNSEINMRMWLNGSYYGLNPENSLLLSCQEAKSLGRVRSCSKKEINLLGIVIPLLEQPDSVIDYYICPH